MGKSAPDAPDYTGAAQATAQSERNALNAQTIANRPNQYTPFGSQTWQQNETFDEAAYNRAMQDWQAQGARLGKGVNTPEYQALRPSQNDFYRTEWSQHTSLTPEAQQALDSQLGLQSGRSALALSLLPRAQQEFGQAMDWSNFDQMGQTPDARHSSLQDYQRDIYTGDLINLDPSQRYQQQAEDAIYGQWSNRQEPRMQQEVAQLETRLRNQGLKPGDQAYNEAMQRLIQDQNDARTNAQYQATIGSGAEASRMFGMDSSARGQMFGERLSEGQFKNQAAGAMNQAGLAANAQNFGQDLQRANYQTQLRQQQIAEAMQKRGFSLNEINAIISGQQVGMPSMPGFNSAGKSAGIDYTGAAQNQYNAALDATNARNAGISNAFGGLTDLASTAMMFSDRRLKKNIVPLATFEKDPKVKLYSYHYLWQMDDEPKQIGVMADEVRHIPGAVTHDDAKGCDLVNYTVIEEVLLNG